ncbi:MAG TPA: NAD-dependent epimerase/dehydratase family protein [candidate division Zixibacteria bacterium]|nr:NAD-dependent epimerase/dehydratase family protein [candidate division Zixibacteria bacterium]
MAKVFITGGTGQVGSHLASYLVKEKLLNIENPEDVICLVRNPQKAEHLKSLGVTLIEGDLQDSDTISEVMENGIDFVFHVAANCLLNQSYRQMYVPNVLGTRIMLDAFVKSKAKCFIYTSSIAVYASFLGRKRLERIDENSLLGNLKGEPYPVSKRIAEGLVHYYKEKYPEKTFITTRLGPVIGAGDKMTIPSLVNIMAYRFLPKLINGGRDLFSVTSPLDVDKAQVFLANIGHNINGDVFNVANDSVTYRHMSTVIAEYYNRKPSTFSIKYWIFKLLLPTLRFFKKLFPGIKLLHTATSPIAINYIGKSFIYNSNKLKKLGFEFTVQARDAIIECLKDLDPDKKLVKQGKKSRFIDENKMEISNPINN